MLQTKQSIEMFSRTCLSKTMIKSDMIDFIKAISCSERTQVSTKQKLVVIFASFLYLSKKNATKVHKI